MTALSRVSLPALDRNQDDLEAALCLILSISEVKRSLLLLLKCSGNPMYFPVPPTSVILCGSFTIAFLSSGVFEEKKINEFPLLVC